MNSSAATGEDSTAVPNASSAESDSPEAEEDGLKTSPSMHSGVLFYDELHDLDTANDIENDVCIFTTSGAETGEGDDDSMAPINLSFAGCGFLGIYHLGVALCLARHGQKLLSRVHRFAGASAGALAASAIAVTGGDTDVLQVGLMY